MEEEQGGLSDGSPGPDFKTGLQYFGAYLGGCWALHQLVGQFFQRAELASQWNSILLIVLVGLIPTVFFVFIYLDRIQKTGLSKRAKYLMSANVAVVFLLLFRISGGTKVDTLTSSEVEAAQADLISELANSSATSETHVFTVFTPEPENLARYSSSQDHIPAAFSESIAYRLSLNPSVRVELKSGFDPRKKSVLTSSEKFEMAKQSGGDRYFDGTYKIFGDTTQYTLNVRSSKNGTILSTREFSGIEVLVLMDSISTYALAEGGLSEEVKQETPALNFREAWSSDSAAVQTYLRGKLDITKETSSTKKAVELDSTFAHAAGAAAYAFFHYNFPISEQKKYGNLAFRNRNRLPRSEQVEVLTTLQLIEKNWPRAEQLLKAQVKNNPRDSRALGLLAKVCFWSGDYLEYDRVLTRRQQIENTLYNRDQLIEAKLFNGNYTAGVLLADESLRSDPSRLSTTLLKAMLFIHMGEHSESEKVLEEALLLYPEWSTSYQGLLASVKYLASVGKDSKLLKEQELSDYFSAELTGYKMRFGYIDGFLFEFSDTQLGAFHYPNSDSSYFSSFFDGGFIEIGVVRDSDHHLHGLAQKTTYKEGFIQNRVVYSVDPVLDRLEQEFIVDSVSIRRQELTPLVESFPYRLYLQDIKDALNYESKAKKAIDDSHLDTYTGVYVRDGVSERSLEKRNGKLYYIVSPVNAYELRLCNDSTLLIVGRRSVRLKVLGLNTEKQRLTSESVNLWTKKWVDDAQYRFKQ